MIRRHESRVRDKRVILLIALLFSITASCAKICTTPKELIGIWKATDIRYSGTSFEIKKGAITFQDKNGGINSYRIVEIKREFMRDEKWVRYTLCYLDNNLKTMEFPFYFLSSDEGMIRFKNQPSLIWKKDTGFVF
jgi:predicted transcriptional regulator with HTH domain